MADRRQRKGDHAGSAGRVVPGDPGDGEQTLSKDARFVLSRPFSITSAGGWHPLLVAAAAISLSR